MVTVQIGRHLWFDELFTFYIAEASTLRRTFDEIRNLDLNPPLIYLVTRTWQSIWGHNETLSRIPVSTAFFLSFLGFFRFLRPRLGALWSAAAVLLFWCTPSFKYATELRPYAFTLMFYALVLCGWDAAHKRDRKRPLACIFVGIIGLISSHVFGCFALVSVWLAELILQMRARRLDLTIWMFLLLPLFAALIYIPLFRSVSAPRVVYPSAFEGGPRKLTAYFFKEFKNIWLPTVVIALAAIAIAPVRWKRLYERRRRLAADQAALVVGLMLIPILLNGLLMFTHRAFFARYAIPTSFSIAVLIIAVLGSLTAFNRLAGLSIVLILASFGIWRNTISVAIRNRQISDQPSLRQFKSELPFVTASGVVFLELDHYEEATFLARVHYLSDRESAARLAHSTLFENISALRRYFPIRADVSPYALFISQNRHFVLYANPNSPEDWLTKKLAEDGAKMTPLSNWIDRYTEGGIVYDVLF
jgi:hypothetical protein